MHARSGRVVEGIGPRQEVTTLPGITFFDAWRVEPDMDIPTDLPSARKWTRRGQLTGEARTCEA